MSELTLMLLRLGLLVLLWLFVLGSIGVLRRDLFGTRLLQRSPAKKSANPKSGRGSSRGGDQRAAETAKHVPTKLVVIEGSMVGTTIDLASAPILVGRAPECTLVLSDDYSSGRHLRVYSEAGRWFVEDLDSTNGTFIGREPVHGTVPVQAGTQVRIGRTVLELRR